MFVGEQHRGERWTDLMWQKGSVTIDKKGWGTFPVAEKSVSVWVDERAPGRERFGWL